MSSDWAHLPELLWYSICEHLPDLTDIIHLASSSQNLHVILESNAFWRHLFRQRYGSVLLKRYCDDIFANKNTSESLCSSDEHWLEFERQYLQLPSAILRNGWTLIVTDAQNGNMSGFAAAKRSKFHLPKISSELKMAIDENVFRDLLAARTRAVLPKLVYFYLSKHLRVSFALQTSTCFDTARLPEAHQPPKVLNDAGSEFGSVAMIDARWLAGLRGHFQWIIPGRYAVRCRFKLDLLRCEQPSVDDQFTGELTCIPEFGVMNSFEWDQDWFDLHYVMHHLTDEKNHADSQWFDERMGVITVYELSKVYFGLRIWQIPYRRYAFMCDYIELNIIE